MPSANDVYITPASRKIEWYGSSAMKGQIHHDDTNFYVSGTLDLKLQGADDISLMGYSGGSIITFGTDQTERMRLTEAGNFGIGTTGPSAKLHVQGTSKLNDWVYLSGSASQRIGGYDTQIWSIANGGTTPATVRHVFATALDWDDNVELRYQIPSTVGDGSGVLKFGQIQKNNANYSHGETQFFTSGAARLTINKQGRVGINTTSPSHGLTVFDTDFYLNSGDMHISQNKYFKNANDGGQSHGFPSSGKYVFNNVDVGIGTTAPAKKLHITGTSEVARFEATEVSIGLKTTRVGDKVYFLGAGNPDGDFVIASGTSSDNIWASSNADTVIRLDGTSGDLHLLPSGNNVGIGTTAPTEALHVYSPDTGNQLGLYSDANEVSALNFYENTTKSAELLFDPSANDLKLINRISGGDMIFRVENNTEAMRILNDGNVGIGDTSPVRKLSVNSAGIDIVSLFKSTDNRASIQLSDDDTNRYINTENSAISLGPNSSLHSNNLNIVGSPADIGIGTILPDTKLHVYHTDTWVGHFERSNGTPHVKFSNDADGGDYGLFYADRDIFKIATRASAGTTYTDWISGIYDNVADTQSISIGNLDATAGAIFYVSGTYVAPKIGIGTTTPAAGLHINSTDSSQLRITSGSAGTFCDFEVSQYGGLTLDVNHSLVLDVTRHIDYKVGSGRLHRFYENNVEKMRLDDGKLGIGTTSPSQQLDVVGAAQIGTLIVTGSTLAVQREMKNDITTDTTLSDSYSSYQAIADGGSVPTVTLTAPSSPSVGDEYVIVGTCIHFPGPPSTNATVRIVANTGQTINGVNTNIQINTSSSGQTYAIARLICIDTNTWVMEVSSCPVA